MKCSLTKEQFKEAVNYIEAFYNHYPSGFTDWRGPYGKVTSDLGYVEDFWDDFKPQLIRGYNKEVIK